MNRPDPIFERMNCGGRPLPRLHPIQSVSRCYGTFGSGDKNQVSTDVQTGSSDNSLAVGNNSVGAKDDGIAQSGYQTANLSSKDNAVLLNNSNVNSGVSNATAGGNITINGAAGAEAISQKFADTIKSINTDAQNLVAQSLSQVSSLSESKQTEGITALGKLALWGLGLVLAGLVLLRWGK